MKKPGWLLKNSGNILSLIFSERPELDAVFFKLYYAIDNHPKKQAPQRPNIFLKMYRVAAVLLVGILIAATVYFSTRGI